MRHGHSACFSIASEDVYITILMTTTTSFSPPSPAMSATLMSVARLFVVSVSSLSRDVVMNSGTDIVGSKKLFLFPTRRVAKYLYLSAVGFIYCFIISAHIFT